MTEIDIPFWLKTPVLWIIKFFKLGLKKVFFIFTIILISIFLSLIIRASIVTGILNALDLS